MPLLAANHTGMATDADVRVYHHDPVFRLLRERSRGTDGDAGRVPAVHARKGDIRDVYVRMRPGLYPAHMSESGAIARRG